MTKGVIFDVDGTLVDSEPLHFEAARQSLLPLGLNLTVEDYREFGMSRGAWNLYEELSQKYKIDIDKERAFTIKKEIFQKLFQEHIALRPGVLQCVRAFSREYLLGIASSGAQENVRYILEKTQIKDYFRVVVTANDVERVKPFPDIYLKACGALGLRAEECLAIEDSETGLRAAKAAGLRCIVVPCEFTKRQDFSQADMVLEDFSAAQLRRLQPLLQ
jgi:beta-phosphoglucomutase